MDNLEKAARAVLEWWDSKKPHDHNRACTFGKDGCRCHIKDFKALRAALDALPKTVEELATIIHSAINEWNSIRIDDRPTLTEFLAARLAGAGVTPVHCTGCTERDSFDDDDHRTHQMGTVEHPGETVAPPKTCVWTYEANQWYGTSCGHEISYSMLAVGDDMPACGFCLRPIRFIRPDEPIEVAKP